MSYGFLAAAELEYLDAVRFYEEQKPGLGASLIHEFERVAALAVSKPDAWKQVHSSGIRCIGLSKFPYSMFYRVAPDGQVQITALAHHRRRPGYWLARVSEL